MSKPRLPNLDAQLSVFLVTSILVRLLSLISSEEPTFKLVKLVVLLNKLVPLTSQRIMSKAISLRLVEESISISNFQDSWLSTLQVTSPSLT